MSDAKNDWVSYQFDFKGEPRSMVGRRHVASDQSIIHMVFAKGMFSFAHWPHHGSMTAFFSHQVSAGRTPLLVDAGANIGAASVYFNVLFQGLKTVAIEPDVVNASLAAHNLRSCDCDMLVGAVARESGTQFLNDIDFGPISYRVGAQGNKAVPAYSVPSILARYDERFVPFILKIDIEGGETELFSGEAPWLDRFPLVIIELHDWMLPHQAVSRNFFRNLVALDFDVLNYGENTFCFNNRILAS